MANQVDDAKKTFINNDGAEQGQFLRVKLTAASGTLIELAGLGEDHIGITQTDNVPDQGLQTVKLKGMGGTVKVVCSEALAIGADLYGAASGKVADTISGPKIGIALNAASANNSVIEMLPIEQLGEIYTHLKSAQAMVFLPIWGWQEADATALAAFVGGASTTPGFRVIDSEGLGISWNNDAAPDPIGSSIPMPQDLDETANVILHILAAVEGAGNDVPTFLVTAFFHTVGALVNADADAGGTTAAMAADELVQELTLTLALADVPASPSALSLTIQPTDGTLGTDDVTIFAVWLEYTRKLLTA